MALKKREKASIVGICIAALILLAGYGAHQIYQEKLAEQAQQQKEELKKIVGMGEFLTLDSKANGQVLADGSQFNPQFDWDGVVAVKIDDAALYDSPEDVINAIGDDAWIGRQDLRTIKNYLVCRVTFRNDDATPLDNARDGRPAFNAGLLGINQGENQGGSLIGITNAINRQDTRDGFCFRVEKGEEVSFYAIFEVPDEVDSDDLSIYYAVTIDDRYACKLTVRDCRG